MPNIFFASDHHFGHANILTFKNSNGTPLRVFDDVNHMNEYMVMQHNRVVGLKDKTYFLGDVAMNKKFLPTLSRMNGEKVLIRGNHDEENASLYLNWFKDVRGVHQFDGMVLSHIPIHPDSLSRWKFNVHGHLHANRVMRAVESGKFTTDGSGKVIDERYQNVSMEQLEDYTPISLEDMKSRMRKFGLIS
jgi:calcineurin-like phosphoesterase family protein